MNNQKNKVLYIVSGIVIGFLIIFLLGPVMRFNGMMSLGNNRGIDSGRSTNVNSIDQHFIEQMIPHHQGAIDMAKLALEKSKHQEVKVLAEAIIKAQTTEIIDMATWYKSWFGKNVPNGSITSMRGSMMSGGGMHMGSKEDMKALDNATDFDKAFIENMIPHHQLAIMMAQMLKSGTNRPEMQTLAENIIDSQLKEIKQMQGWYNSWYR